MRIKRKLNRSKNKMRKQEDQLGKRLNYFKTISEIIKIMVHTFLELLHSHILN